MIVRGLLAVVVLGGALGYTLWHVWALLPFPQGWRTALTALFALMVLCMSFVVLPIIDRLPLSLGTVVYEIGGTGLMVMLYTLLSFAVLDILRLVHVIPRSVVFSNGWTALVLTLFLIVVFVAGNVHYHHKVRQSLLLTTDKPLSRDYKILLISDLHLGYHNRRAALERWASLLAAEHADVILIAGDVVDRSIRPLLDERMYEVLRQLNAPVYACVGNHEFYCGLDKAVPFYRSAGITLLIDSVTTVGELTIIGRRDRMGGPRQSLPSLVAAADTSRYTIVLDHQPWHLEEAEENGVDFQFSGHTHNGQVIPLSWAVGAVYENAYGASARGKTQYYVSSGLGIWGGKFRIGTCSEYVVATLHSTAQ